MNWPAGRRESAVDGGYSDAPPVQGFGLQAFGDKLNPRTCFLRRACYQARWKRRTTTMNTRAFANRLPRSLNPRRNDGARGFTLLELLVVIVIIGLLAGLVLPRYFDTVEKSKAKIARAQMDSLEKALEQYRLDTGALPTPEQGLEALMTAPAGMAKWQGPYLKKGVPPDPWGNRYVYKLSTNRRDPEIISLGADGLPGGTGEAADIALSAPAN